MSCYVLDTDICIYWLKGKVGIKEKVENIGVDNLRITIITLAELRYGAYNSRNVRENLKNIDNFIRKVRALPLDEAASDVFGTIKVELRRSGQMIEDFDILIASITLTNNGILVTNNVDHFKRISGLSYENWLE